MKITFIFKGNFLIFFINNLRFLIVMQIFPIFEIFILKDLLVLEMILDFEGEAVNNI